MKQKQLAIELSKLKTFIKPKAELEQYQTEGNLAAELLFIAYQNEDINGRIIADLGCGTGILGYGALLLGAKKVYFVDTDKEALNITKENCKKYKNLEFINKDIRLFNKKVDTVIMNPPFGVQNRKADKVFLEQALKIAKKIYSIHKIESKNFIDRIAQEYSFHTEKIITKEFLLKKTMFHHKKKNYNVNVGVWILEKNQI